MNPDLPTKRETRRRFLQATGIAGLAAGIGVPTSGQEDGEEDEEEDEREETPTVAEDATTILLGGEVEHWFGLAPPAIHEEENPTLTLQAGEQYRLVWMNLEDVEHELIIEDADGEELEETESSERAGETRAVVFTASEEMTEYYCEYHPQSMRGDVELGEGFQTPTETTRTETTPTETPADGGDA